MKRTKWYMSFVACLFFHLAICFGYLSHKCLNDTPLYMYAIWYTIIWVFQTILIVKNCRGCLLKIWPIPIAHPRPNELDYPRGQGTCPFKKCPSDFIRQVWETVIWFLYFFFYSKTCLNVYPYTFPFHNCAIL